MRYGKPRCIISYHQEDHSWGDISAAPWHAKIAGIHAGLTNNNCAKKIMISARQQTYCNFLDFFRNLKLVFSSCLGRLFGAAVTAFLELIETVIFERLGRLFGAVVMVFFELLGRLFRAVGTIHFEFAGTPFWSCCDGHFRAPGTPFRSCWDTVSELL